MAKTLTFVDQVEQVIANFPTLRREEWEGMPCLTGSLSITDPSGRVWESFDIRIVDHGKYPGRYPVVYEIGGKIPAIPDWHVNTNGTCCLEVEPAEILRCNKSLTLVSFIAEVVVPYFANQAYRRVEGIYAGKEYSHGAVGIFEYLSRRMGTGSDVNRTLINLQYYITLRRKQPKLFTSNRGKKGRFKDWIFLDSFPLETIHKWFLDIKHYQ